MHLTLCSYCTQETPKTWLLGHNCHLTLVAHYYYVGTKLSLREVEPENSRPWQCPRSLAANAMCDTNYIWPTKNLTCTPWCSIFCIVSETHLFWPTSKMFLKSRPRVALVVAVGKRRKMVEKGKLNEAGPAGSRLLCGLRQDFLFLFEYFCISF